MYTYAASIPKKNYSGFLSGSFLKVFAIAIMFIDHFAAGIIYPSIVTDNLGKLLLDYHLNEFKIEDYDHFYLVLRGIGRFAFPIFCYLLVEGFMHTRNKARYAITLFIFGII